MSKFNLRNLAAAFAMFVGILGISSAAKAEVCADGTVISWKHRVGNGIVDAIRQCNEKHGGVAYACFDNQGCRREGAALRPGVKYCTNAVGAGNKGSAPLPYCNNGSSYSRQAWEEYHMTCAQKKKLGYVSMKGCEGGQQYSTVNPPPAASGAVTASSRPAKVASRAAKRHVAKARVAAPKAVATAPVAQPAAPAVAAPAPAPEGKKVIKRTTTTTTVVETLE